MSKISKADEMFEELRFSKLNEVENKIITVYRNCRGKHIQFNHATKKVSFLGDYRWVDMQELQAINQKCKELGWIE